MYPSIKTFTTCLFGLFGLLIIFPGHSCAQSAGPGSAYIKNLEDALCLVRVDYVLHSKDPKDKDQQNFGRDGHEYFGRAAGLAFISEGRLWFDERLIKPWQHFDQSNYERYKRDTMLEPRIMQVSIRRISAKKFMKLGDDFSKIESGPVATWKLEDSLAKPMLLSLPEVKDTNGMLVIATLDKGQSLDDDDVKITLVTSQPTRGFNFDKTKDEWGFAGGLTGALSNLGGIWMVYKEYPQGDGTRGIYALKAAGIGRRAGLNWQIVPLPRRVLEGTRAELNPIKKPTPAAGETEKKNPRKADTGKSSIKGHKNDPPKVKPIEDSSH